MTTSRVFPATSFVAVLLCVNMLMAAERPPVTHPRATSGDTVAEPRWDQRLTVTVGPEKADLIGTSDRVLQSAVDYVARLGGGTVKVLPGTYRMRNALVLQSRIRLVGSGTDSILLKEPSVTTKLVADTDWYDQEITLADATGFEVGDGVALFAKDKPKAGRTIVKRTLVARSGNRFKLDRAPRENLWQIGEARVSTLFPLLSGDNVSDIAIENITLDGNRTNNENLDGNYAGCIFLQDCNRITIRGVTARNYNGDGISWQICHDVVVENSASLNNTGLGLHPGSGSQRPIIRNNRIEGNDIGIFFCWGVKYGLAEKNHLIGNRVGVSIGHRDTDNLVCDNEILRSKSVGVLFRPERGKDFAGHRNRIEHNRIVDSGDEKGIAIDVQGATESIVIARNTIIETRGTAHRSAVRLGKETRDIKLLDNTIEGFATDTPTKEAAETPKATPTNINKAKPVGKQ
ncbi:MAG: right-handed parallel beta-helix repeat-containing protein [Verrucomicrobia bacterium]|nr:right-handed parallel beta-helix repeat-containing protein [Verrucomicrobiota bacterium]